MFYKLSNTASVRHVEDAFGAKFKYPQLHEENILINGLTEQSLPIITMDNHKAINLGIWGMLPQNYRENWIDFQNLNNTLNISIDDVSQLSWTKNLPEHQRCVIIVTGYFTTYLFDGEIYPYYVHQKDHEPFALAGMYSKLNDGFLSVAIITSEVENQLNEIHNIGKQFPIALSQHEYQSWFYFNKNSTSSDINILGSVKLQAHTISKEFYKNDIVFDTLLDAAHYKNLPILSLK